MFNTTGTEYLAARVLGTRVGKHQQNKGQNTDQDGEGFAEYTFEPLPSESIQGNNRGQRCGGGVDQAISDQDSQQEALRIGSKMEGHLRPLAARVGQRPELRIID
jgi:hypothetical protein